ncbi:MBL fold metallo-hydrolase [Ornithinibacillus xuwenensis]|uniref:MBL fold metallo-hydrolase n=1 Tax=Ornithinibacillus xuwenensis TaxID=3144668 RepID=A0ABU9XLD4_9BACI
MYKRILLPLLLVILLVACGQNEENNGGIPSNTDTVNAQQETGDNESSANTTNSPSEERDKGESDNNHSESLPELSVHYIDVGQADATLLQYGEHAILFDTGDWRGNEVVEYLRAQGISNLDLVIGSHPDADHIGQLEDVMHSFTVSEVWLSGNESTSETFQGALEAILNSDATYHEPRTGEEFAIGPMELTVLYPKSITGEANEESISVLFSYGETDFLFTGDADKNGEKQMLNFGIDIDADIIQLGHHGSNTSSDESFIREVSPEIAIYSAGKDNSYGHPHTEVISLMENLGITLYGTDVHGTIIVTTDGSDYSVKTKADGTITPSSHGEKSDSNTTGSTTTSEADQNDTATDGCVNINTASYEAVQQIIHIGPDRAQDLIDLRPYNSVSDLERISGIGPARIADIQSQGIACVN